MATVDLNCDLGESFGAYTIGMDASLMPYITSANVACGYHAGDAIVMEKTARLCKENNVAIGAHPGFPDLQGFGRRNLAVTPAEAKAYVQYQVGALLAFCCEQGLTLHHVKPHGALYNMAAKDYALAEGICLGIEQAIQTFAIIWHLDFLRIAVTDRGNAVSIYQSALEHIGILMEFHPSQNEYMSRQAGKAAHGLDIPDTLEF